MESIIIDPKDRKTFVGASEAAALFNLHPHISARQLYHMKRGELPDQIDNAVMRRGRIFEPAIAQLYSETYNAPIEKWQEIIPHPTIPGLACTPDYRDALMRPIEFKTTRYMKKTEEAADHHKIQVNTQMMCTGGENATLAYCDMNRDEDPFIIFQGAYDKDMAALVEEAVAKFWESVRAGEPPAVTVNDIQILNQIFKENPIDEAVDLNDDYEFRELVRDFQSTNEERKELEKAADHYKAAIFDRMGLHMRARIDGMIVERKIINMPEKVVSAHKQVRLYFKTPKGE